MGIEKIQQIYVDHTRMLNSLGLSAVARVERTGVQKSVARVI